MESNFNKYPVIEVSNDSSSCFVGWSAIIDTLNTAIHAIEVANPKIVIDCYQGVNHEQLITTLNNGLRHDQFINSTSAFKGEEQIAEMVYPDVTDDRIFGVMTKLSISDFFDSDKLDSARKEVAKSEGVTVVYGEGAALLVDQPDLLVYLDLARWELQLRMRDAKVDNLGVKNAGLEFLRQYKQSFFVDWRVLDKHKVSLLNDIDFLIDTNKENQPKMISGEDFLKGLKTATTRPFRVVPFFDPGPWGGQWLKEVVDLDRSKINFAWGFDCVPEENSLLFSFGQHTVEVPSIDLVFQHPEALLGDAVYEKFGAEFPIRFDFLDTMDGGNLSLQVHPTSKYINKHFGMTYTQDESYYMLDAKDDAFVYLGLKDDADGEEMISELKEAQSGEVTFDADKHVKKWKIKKHDHLLIPAGTVHCSGKDSVVLEISATPYIFTFKLWDWGRLGLDGKPRPINIEHGEQVIDWTRREEWTKKNLINPIEVIEENEVWKEEKTGLHELEFIETRRHWFTGKVPHNTNGGVNVLNLVEGKEAIVESPNGHFEPFVVHFAETFIVPAAVGDYTIRPYGQSEGQQCATIKAFVRTDNWRESWVIK
ncbi:class I mannose-6-phosphate isomerase [Roseivirga pacifica]|uniref:class I mannose-6-phosphate isomerase n=1 Tax=Roseivirga pacifica TaxID=1267423 RepID=UPI003BAFED51